MINRILAMLLTAMLALPAGAGALDSELARAAGMEAYPVPLKAPTFDLPALAGEAGEAHAKAHYQGKVVLLNFWASWCPPCREEFPSLERLQQSLGGKDFTVLAVSVMDCETGIARFLGGHKPPFDVLLDTEGKTARNYRAMGVPVTYLLDLEGRMLAGKTGPQAWDSAEMQRLIRQVIDLNH